MVDGFNGEPKVTIQAGVAILTRCNHPNRATL